MDIKEGFKIFAVGMFFGVVSQLAFNYNPVLGILGYFITVMIIVGITFKDNK